MAAGLLERDDALALVAGLIERAVAGVGGALLVEASAGMGKTALLDEARARSRDTRVLVSRGSEMERNFALGVVRQLLDPSLRGAGWAERHRWLQGAAVAETVLRGEVAERVEDGVAFNALYWVLAAMAADAPVLLVVDDVHWCDVESLRWLGFVVRRWEGVNLAVLLAARPPDVQTPQRAFTALQDEPRVQRVVLEPLTSEATAVIVRARFDAADDTFVAACHEASGGNPFLLRELLSVVGERGLAANSATAGQVALLASEGLQRAVLARVSALGDDALAVARATALVAVEAAVPLVADLANLAPEDVAAAAQTLQRVELFATGRLLSFRHPLLRAAVLSGLGDVAVTAGHLRAARVLRERGAAAEQIAAHLVACDVVGEVWAVDVLEQAARGALARASPRLAARLLERALEEPGDAARKLSLGVEMGGALTTAGDTRGIDVLLLAAQGVDDPLRRAELAVRLAIPMWSAGRVRELPAVLRDASSRLPAGNAQQLFALAATRAQAAAWGSGESVPDAVAAAVALIPATGDDSLSTRHGLALLAVAATHANRPRREIAMLARRALGDADAHASAITTGVPLMPAVWMLHLAEDTKGVEGAFARVEAGQRARGALAIGLSTTLASRAICLVRSGALLDAQADAELALQAASTESFAPLRNIATAAIARVDAERGFPRPALALIDAQLACDSGRGAEQLTLRLERAQVLRALRRPRDAADVAQQVGVEAQAVGFEGATMLLWPAVAAEAVLELGDAEHAAQLAARGVELAERFGAPGPIGCALRVSGLAERDLEILQAAERSLAGSSMRLEHARSLVELGAALRRDGQRTSAREPLAAGMELAHRCAANALVARAHQELRAAGARPRSVVRSGVDALTASELRTARLAADGLTNREIAQHLFVTQKTIQTQLRAAYRKLDIAGRGDLKAVLDD
jgi:DNA-binding CsgD family transcriptional regulator